MKKSIVCLLLAFSLVGPVLADTLKIPEDKPVASITFPEDWTATATADGIAASSGDDGVLINIITTNPAVLGASIDKAFAMLKAKPDADTWKDAKSTLNGMNIVTHTLDAKDDKGTVKLVLTGVEVTKDKGILVILRGAGQAAHQEEITAIMKSIAPVK
ncbi:MAG: hypothetical protein QOH88_1387 [Verrucomicrobiota bacterium]|jgi:hypothetical protein